MIEIDQIAKLIKEGLQPLSGIDLEEEKKIRRMDEKPEVSREVKCFHCGKYFYEKNWHTPPSCPFCHRSRVD